MQKLKKYAASKAGRDTLLSFGIVIIAFVVMQAMLATGAVSSLVQSLLVRSAPISSSRFRST